MNCYTALLGYREYQPPLATPQQLSCSTGERLLQEADDLRSLLPKDEPPATSAPSPLAGKIIVNDDGRVSIQERTPLDLATVLRTDPRPPAAGRPMRRWDECVDYARINKRSIKEKDHLFPICAILFSEEKKEGQDSWLPRRHMFETAATDTKIFSLSIVPKEPSIFQLWFFKQAVTPLKGCHASLAGLHETYGFFDRKQRAYGSMPTPQDHPRIMQGLVKPYPTFCSAKYQAEIDPEHLPANVTRFFLSRLEEIPSAIEDISPLDLREKVHTILTDFLNDPHAAEAGMTILQPASMTVKKRLFSKLSVG
jgi:hypothetical protein